ncbi:MAG TPA: hypothetical protein VFV39_07975 [Limnobacter sp.]|nr:hypothetical protein [Limnobacter sp.]
MSTFECIAHVDELYIRSYPRQANADNYGLKLIDFPVTVRLDGQVVYMRYRRGWDQRWKLYCSDDQMLALRKALAAEGIKPAGMHGLDHAVAQLFEDVDARCAQAVSALPAYPTRRDVLQHLIEQSVIAPLLGTTPDEDGLAVRFYYLGGQTLVGVLGHFLKTNDVLAVCEISAEDWKALCQDVQRVACEGSEAVDALVLERVSRWMGEQEELPLLEDAA